MYIDAKELHNQKMDIQVLLKNNNYSDEFIQRFSKTLELVCNLAEAKICRTFSQQHCWFDQYFQGFNRNRYHKDLSLIRAILDHSAFSSKAEPNWKRNSDFQTLSSEYRRVILFYSESAQKRGLKTSSINVVIGYGIRFLNAFKQEGFVSVKEIREKEVIEYFLKENHQSFACHQSIRALFRENMAHEDISLQKECARVGELIPAVRNVRKNIQFFTTDEVEKLKSALLIDPTPFTLRDRAVCLLAMYTGLRGSDISTLCIDSIDWDNNTISIVQKKTAVPLCIPLTPVVGNAIYDYIMKERPIGTSIPELFICRTQPYKKMNTVGYCLNIVLDYCGIRQGEGERKGLHLLRHHLATTMLSKNVTVPVISNILGHSSTEATQRYLRTDLVHLKELALDISEFPVMKESLQ
jgi:integrase